LTDFFPASNEGITLEKKNLGRERISVEVFLVRIFRNWEVISEQQLRAFLT
jgi:hypothetical protein